MPPPRTEWSDAVFNQLIASPKFISTYVPSASLFFAMLGYLAGVGIFAWLWQKKRLAPRLLLMGFSTFVAAGTAAGYVHFSQGGNIPDGVLLVSTVLENSGDGFVDSQANMALFSTQLRQYDLQLERGWIDLTPVSSRAREQFRVGHCHARRGRRESLPFAAARVGLSAVSLAPRRSFSIRRRV